MAREGALSVARGGGVRRPAGHRGLESRWRELKARPWWPWAKHGATLAFLSLVAVLIIVEARKVNWHAVLAAIEKLPWPALLTAVALAFFSHLVYASYDLVARRYVGHRLSVPLVLAVCFVSYSFNLNMGYLVGGAGIRFRLYSRLGLKLDDIARILSLGVITNWLGYMVLAGVVLIIRPFELPAGWMANSGVPTAIGVLLILVPAGYVGACGLAKKRVAQIRGHRLVLPSLRIALLQIALSTANWMVMGALLYTLFQQRIDYWAVLGTLLAAAVAGVISHIPAGLGVLEAVFVTLLGDRLPKEELLAVLLTYRAVYYLLPLSVAAVAYFVFEAKLKKKGQGRINGTRDRVGSGSPRK